MNALDNYEDNYLFGLDICAGSVYGMIGLYDGNRFIVKVEETLYYDSAFISECDLNDIDKVSESVKAVKDRLMERCGKELTDAVISVPSVFLKSKEYQRGL